jgi:GH15 family glucan-1,4-alpha-glucosidase
MILETEFVCDGGVARLIDLMPVGSRCDVVRIVEGVEGEVPLEMLLNIRFGYGANAPLLRKLDYGMYFMAGPDAMVLRSPLNLERQNRRASTYFHIKKGERVPMQLTWFASHEKPPEAIDVERALTSTECFWRDWAGRCTYQGRWRDAIIRSMITLKAMTYAPTGPLWRLPRLHCPRKSEASATGIIVFAGCATRV